MQFRPCQFFISTTFLPFLLLACMAACNKPASPEEDPDREEWIRLFNGRDLSDWQVKIAGYPLGENYQNTFVAEDSMIKVQYNGYESFERRFGHLFYKEPYSYYRLRVDYRFVGEQAPGGEGWAFRNSGVMLHGQPAGTMLKDQDFPVSIEAQFLGGDGEHDRTTLNLCTPGTHVVIRDSLETAHCISSSSKTYHGDQWVKAELLVLGDSLIRHIIDGDVVLEYAKPQLGGGNVAHVDPAWVMEGKPVVSGTISLQSESHPVHFRKVELLNLEGCMDKEANNYKSYFVKPKNSLCIYD